jgi:hypothetical protein
MPQNHNCTTINFQLEKELKDALYAAASAAERTASAEIRVALRAHLGQPPPSEQPQSGKQGPLS